MATAELLAEVRSAPFGMLGLQTPNQTSARAAQIEATLRSTVSTSSRTR